MRQQSDFPTLRLAKSHPNKRKEHPFAEPQRREGRVTRRAKRRLAARVKAWPSDGKSHTGLAMHKPGSMKKS
jgi:hypothetical protein